VQDNFANPIRIVDFFLPNVAQARRRTLTIRHKNY
jgi:hypothetical protein